MTGQGYTIAVYRSVRRALAETLPLDVAAGAAGLFFAGALSADPYRVGRPLDAPLDGVHWARLDAGVGRVPYVIDDDKHVVIVRAVVHRRDVHRSR